MYKERKRGKIGVVLGANLGANLGAIFFFY